MYRKVPLDKKTTLLWRFKHRSGIGADFEVKAVLPYTKSDKQRKRIGIAKIIIEDNKNAEIADIYVESHYRHKGVGSKILKFVVDYLEAGTIEKIKATDLKGSKDLEIAIKFYEKNGFSVDVEHSEANLVLNKPKFPQFGYLYKDIEAIRRAEYNMF